MPGKNAIITTTLLPIVSALYVKPPCKILERSFFLLKGGGCPSPINRA